MNNKLLTISTTCYDDFDGVYFTVQSLRARVSQDSLDNILERAKNKIFNN
jgi:hypothetical protein